MGPPKPTDSRRENVLQTCSTSAHKSKLPSLNGAAATSQSIQTHRQAALQQCLDDSHLFWANFYCRLHPSMHPSQVDTAVADRSPDRYATLI